MKRNNFTEFWAYWFENVMQAKHRFDFVMLVLAGICFTVFFFFLGGFVSYPRVVEKFCSEKQLEYFVGTAATVVLVFWCFIWLPFRRHEAQKQFYEDEKVSLIFMHREEKQSLEERSNSLRAELDDRSIKAQQEHDKRIFEKLNHYADEATVRGFCEVTGGYQFYDYEAFSKITDVEHYGIQDENQFLNTTLRRVFLEFHKELDAFTTLVAHVFFSDDGKRYKIYPELKYSDEPDKRKIYEDALSKTRDASDKVLVAYSSFRLLVKETLYI